MKKMLIAGLLLILLGIVSLIGEGIPYKKNKEMVNVGPVHASTEITTKVLIPPALGVVLLIGGVVLVAVGIRESKTK
ncbi:MAG TPA: DUF3185 domain-containing protein [Terriglobia bacterium]|nr:DUF3185 domain-containing protein [Terriglobia bacterium]